MSIAAVEACLSRAREARRENNGEAALDALRSAVELADSLGEIRWIHRCRWRLAKALYDFATVEVVFEFLRPLCKDGLLTNYPSALQAMGPLSAKYWDEVTYGDLGLREVWQTLAAECREANDPFVAAWCETQLAWDWAVCGQRRELEAWLHHWEHQLPRTFGDGPSKAVLSPDTPTSVYWVQMDVARTVLRAAVWGGWPELAFRAKELYLDAVADSGHPPPFWMLETVSHGALRFGWQEEDVVEQYRLSVAELRHERATFHQEMAAAWLSPTAQSLSQACEAAENIGPEWEAACRLRLWEFSGEVDERCLQLVNTFGLEVFRSRLTALGTPTS